MVSQLTLGIIAFAPAMAVLYGQLGKHEDHFRDTAMFWVLLGGIGLGMAGGFVELIIMGDSAWLVAFLAAALIETMAKTMIVGLPRFRGNEETVLLGGAAGLGVAAIVTMLYAQFIQDQVGTWRLFVTVGSVAIGFTLVHYVAGLKLGQGPASGSILGTFLPSLGILLPAHLLLAMLGLTEGLRLNPFVNYQDIEVAILLLAYGVALMVWLSPKLVRQGLPPEERKRLRRERLKRSREEGRS